MAEWAPDGEQAPGAQQWDRLVGEYLMTWVPAINERLQEQISRHDGSWALFSGPMGHLVWAGGKRFRSVLAVVACELVGGDPRRALDAACAIEFLHTSSLIIDDLPCMDNATQRRGVEALHVKYGEATALLTAFTLFNLAHELLASSGQGLPCARERHLYVASAVGRMMMGQQVDLTARDRRAVGGQETEELRLLKTSALIAAAIAAGAYSGGASDLQVECLGTFGYKVGRLFQLVDDAMDGEGSTPAQALRDEVEEALSLLSKGFPAPSSPRLVLEGLTRLVIRRTL